MLFRSVSQSRYLEEDDEEFIQRGFRTTPTEIDPETGTVTSKVEYIPSFEKVRRDLC